MARPSIRLVISGALSGKTIGRILFNYHVRRWSAGLSGRVLDLAGGARPSYLELLPRDIELIRTDIRASEGVVAVDMNEPLPFDDNSLDAVLLFSALYAAENPASLAKEIMRVLKSGGSWYLGSPFIANEMPEPHDYVRFTGEGLERLCKNAGFEEITIERIGERASAATHLLQPFFLFNVVRAVAFPLALLLDRLIPRRVREQHPTPLSYFVTATKSRDKKVSHVSPHATLRASA